MTAAIQFENLSKVYHIGARQSGDYFTLRESLMQAAAAPWRRLLSFLGTGPVRERASETHWALRNVSFAVQPGEVIGIIGRNGAGKSTLLKILSQITEPSSGRIVCRGRVGSLLEVGTGFHHELSGRENIYLNGAILGMSRREINRKFDDMVAFADIGTFLDTPVKHYSSGMYVRLAFAVASHLEPEILVVDEVLAVGDAAFQKKCLGKMDEVSRSGRTVLFVSHSMAAIQNLCSRVAVLEQGQVVFTGDCASGINNYLSRCGEPSGGAVDLSRHPQRRPGARATLRRLCLRNGAGQLTDQFSCGEPIAFELLVDPTDETAHLHFGVIVEDAFGTKLCTIGSYLSDSVLPPLLGPSRVIGRLDHLDLAPGRYAISLIAGPIGKVNTEVIDQAAWFDVIEADFYGNGRLPEAHRGRFLTRSRWEVVG
jgi:lipopolysaccharide transport system ATP-binding protein